MENTSKAIRSNHNIIKLLHGREKKVEVAKSLQRNCHFTEPLIKRLGLEYELEGHQGCVNCLQWTADGRHLASGSDDTNVKIWDPFCHRLLKTVPTPHIGNIFSVKFLGSDGSLIATGAGDCRVVVQSLEHAVSRQTPHLDCACHVNRVKRLATAPDQPLLFWSAGEDGLVIQYDIREPHECLVKSKVFIDLSYTSEIKCIAVNPTQPHLVAIGANDCFIRLYDRRMVRTSSYRPSHTFDPRKRTPAEPQDPKCVQYYAPGHLAKDNGGDMSYKLGVTYIAFNSSGSEMLVNMSGEQIYLFDMHNPRHINQLRVPDCLPKRKNSCLYKPCCKYDDAIKSSKKLHTYNKRISDDPCACDYVGRAKTLFQRKWTGDVYSAARDYLHVIQLWPNNKEAYIGIVQCLLALKWVQEACDWLECFRNRHPQYAENIQVKELQADLIASKNINKKEETEESANDKSLSDEEKQSRVDSLDYEIRFLGHCNTTTDIKEANFLGDDGNYICAGSDDGVIFIWDRKTTNVVTALWGDVSIVNCIQPHPSCCFIASSGIDPVVKLWSPLTEDGSDNSRVVIDPWAAVAANQQRMSMDPFETMLANMGYRISPLDTASLHEIPTCRTS